MAKKNGGPNFILGAIVGGVVGAATALILAPKSGQEFREQLNGQASVVKEKTNSLSKTLTEQSNQFLSKAKGFKDSNQNLTSEQPQPEPEQSNESETNESNDKSNEQLFQEKLAEAQKALTDAENGVHNNQ